MYQIALIYCVILAACSKHIKNNGSLLYNNTGCLNKKNILKTIFKNEKLILGSVIRLVVQLHTNDLTN